MLYSFKKINIEAPFPTTQCGHSVQTELVYEFKDHLYARVIGFKENDKHIIHVSLDQLCFSAENRDILQNRLRKFYNSNLTLITSATHTHYANSARDDKYVEFLLDTLYKEITSMEYEEKNSVTSSFQKIHSTACGKSRISGYETNLEFLCLLRFYEEEKEFLTVIINNCHPTTLEATVPYFSSEYPGNTLRMLEEKHPDKNFSFIMGCSGDISSRFVRSGQNYEAMLELARKLSLEVEEQLSLTPEKKPLKLDYKETVLPYENEFTPIDLSNIRADLSPRELQTIEIGQQMRERMQNSPSKIFGQLPPSVLVGAWDIGSVKIIFYPNEIFSDYLTHINLDNTYLVSYSNGYGPYILPIGFEHITYEMFIDTLTDKTKENLIKTIKSL